MEYKYLKYKSKYYNLIGGVDSHKKNVGQLKPLPSQSQSKLKELPEDLRLIQDTPFKRYPSLSSLQQKINPPIQSIQLPPLEQPSELPLPQQFQQPLRSLQPSILSSLQQPLLQSKFHNKLKRTVNEHHLPQVNLTLKKIKDTILKKYTSLEDNNFHKMFDILSKTVLPVEVVTELILEIHKITSRNYSKDNEILQIKKKLYDIIIKHPNIIDNYKKDSTNINTEMSFSILLDKNISLIIDILDFKPNNELLGLLLDNIHELNEIDLNILLEKLNELSRKESITDEDILNILPESIKKKYNDKKELEELYI
jgi:hypothetical protein